MSTVATMLASCATILRKDFEKEVEFNTEPNNAQVFVDGKLIGESPVTYKLDSREKYAIKYVKENYADQEYDLEGRILFKWVALDIISGGVAAGWIPVIVDAVTDKWRDFDQLDVDAYRTLKQGESSAIKDADKDGIPDEDDACPNEYGPKNLKGCPDSDGDGFIDKEDKCPNTPGTVNGCPVKDSDNDGIADEDDDCPNQAGEKKFNGCPDTDKDGIADNKDKCPNTFGVASNGGCPELKKEEKEVLERAMRGIHFKSGSSIILSKSYPILDEVANVMASNPKAQLKIEGHTDNTGKYETNMRLSRERAAAVKSYLEGKGIESNRMASEGFGPDVPVADNSTAEGRALNRRVEFKVSY